MVPALLHYSKSSKQLRSVVVQRRGNHRDELGGVKETLTQRVSGGFTALRGFGWEFDDEIRLSWSRSESQCSVQRLPDERIDDRQSQAGAAATAAGCEEGFKDSWLNVLRDSATEVANSQLVAER